MKHRQASLTLRCRRGTSRLPLPQRRPPLPSHLPPHLLLHRRHRARPTVHQRRVNLDHVRTAIEDLKGSLAVRDPAGRDDDFPVLRKVRCRRCGGRGRNLLLLLLHLVQHGTVARDEVPGAIEELRARVPAGFLNDDAFLFGGEEGNVTVVDGYRRLGRRLSEGVVEELNRALFRCVANCERGPKLSEAGRMHHGEIKVKLGGNFGNYL